jgi:hypothetical protein
MKHIIFFIFKFLKINNIFKKIIRNKIPLNSFFYTLDLDQNYHVMQASRKSYYKKILKKMTLSELFILFKTDKSPLYSNIIFDKKKNKYTRSLITGENTAKYYSEINRSKVKNIVEIGSYKGSSAAAFVSYFFNSKIFCFDIDFSKNFIKCARIHKVKLDQSNVIEIEKTLNKFNINKSINFVSDDGIHEDEYILKSFNILFAHLVKNGKYFIEDITKSKTPIIYKLFCKKKINLLYKNYIDLENIKKIKNIRFFKTQMNYKVQSGEPQNYIAIISKK